MFNPATRQVIHHNFILHTATDTCSELGWNYKVVNLLFIQLYDLPCFDLT